jgi:NAD(P)-dependent dehydrogenase (short-subunit alcohol dehydrogenase family)
LNVREVLPDDLFAGKTVFVTGGGSGINLGVARNFAALGAGVAICGRTEERLESARAELESLGARVVTAVADVRDYDALAAAFEETRQELGPIDVLVCGAAGNFLAPAEKLTANGFKAVVDIDLLGSFNASHAAFEQLKETRGTILFISAGQGSVPHYWQAHAGAAKAGVDNLMRNLALEWGPYGIRSNCIVPGPIAGTEGMKRLGPGDDAVHSEFKKTIPLGRYGSVDDIGQAAVFLASPLASYVTGTLLGVDGGTYLPGAGLMADKLRKAMAAGAKAEG